MSAALVDPRKPLNPEQREHAQGLLERSRLFVDVYRISTSPPDTRVVVDGQSLESEPDGSLLLGFGTHIVEASKPGYSVRSCSVNVRGGERRELIVNLDAKPQAPPAAATPAPSPTSGQPAPARTTVALAGPSAGWYWGAAGAGMLGVAAATYWILENAELTSCRNPSQGLACNNESEIETQRNLAIGATAVAGTAAVTMAVIGVLRRKTRSDNRADSAWSYVVLRAGIACAKAF